MVVGRCWSQAAATLRTDGAYDVEAHAGVELPALLSAVSRWPGLREVASEQQRLHEIYVDVVSEAGGGDASSAKYGTETDSAEHSP